MTAGLDALALTKTFAGDVAAQDKVNATDLDAQLARIVAYVNQQLVARALDPIERSDQTLADGVVRQRNLHAEVGKLFRLLMAWVDDGVRVLEECYAATIGDHSLTGLAALDGATIGDGDRILVRAQADPTQNGIYLAHSGAWTRAPDADSMTTIGFAFVYVDHGDTLSGTAWLSDAGVAGTIGSVDIPWLKLYRDSRGATGDTGAAGAGFTSIADQTLIGNNTGSPATPIALTATDAQQILGGWNQQYLYDTKALISTTTGLADLVELLNARVIITDDSSPLTMTLPKAMAKGLSFIVFQRGAGQVTFTAESGAAIRNRQGHSKTAGQYAAVTLLVVDNADGSSAEYLLQGDTAS